MLKKLLIALLPLGSIAVIIWLVWPEYTAMQEAKALRQAAYDQLEAKKTLVAKIKKLEDQYKKVENVAEKTEKIIPQTPDIPNLLVELSQIANQNGLIMDSISFDVTEGSAKSPSTRTVTAAGKPYQSMKASISVIGSYESFQNYLKSLENELRIMDVNSITFSTPEEVGRYTFNLAVNMYFGLQV